MLTCTLLGLRRGSGRWCSWSVAGCPLSLVCGSLAPAERRQGRLLGRASRTAAGCAPPYLLDVGIFARPWFLCRLSSDPKLRSVLVRQSAFSLVLSWTSMARLDGVCDQCLQFNVLIGIFWQTAAASGRVRAKCHSNGSAGQRSSRQNGGFWSLVPRPNQRAASPNLSQSEHRYALTSRALSGYFRDRKLTRCPWQVLAGGQRKKSDGPQMHKLLSRPQKREFSNLCWTQVTEITWMFELS